MTATRELFVGPKIKPPSECSSRPGEFYQLGRHVLACGDATDHRLVQQLLADAGDEVVTITDPPYSSGARQEAKRRVSTSVGRREMKRSQTPSAKKEGSLTRDNLSTVGYQTLLLFAFTLAGARVREGYVFCDARMWGATEGVMEALGLPVVAQVVWDKLSAGLGRGWKKRHELIAYGARPDVPDRAFETGRPGAFGDVIGIKRDKTWSKFHPTPKPARLIRKLIQNTDEPVIYDPFVGSGTVFVAAEVEKRRARGVELVPWFCDVARMRWGAYARKTGVDPGPGAL